MAESSSKPDVPLRSASEPEREAKSQGADGHGISFDFPKDSNEGRPTPVSHASAPVFQSPIRHHQRTPSRTRQVKETLDAHSHYGSSDDDGAAIHRINQYIIKQEIGRGSFGSVHLAVDQYGTEYAVKEFSKSRLRKRAQSNLLRRPHPRRSGHIEGGMGLTNQLQRLSSSERKNDNQSLNLIKEEIAIMKKLNHNNLVSLIEVLDDPQEDSLYMVLEICKKGVAMKVGLDERAEPYDDETCRCWFRDMILGIEYLHAQGIIHRDLKPDNCLITNDDVLKIVDFGVSEMFEKESDMSTAKSAGSPAFMPPELCVAKHGQVRGRAADIWSMGVTLYCLRYGRIPFEKSSMLELYESIRTEEVPLDEERDPKFCDLMRKMLDKDPKTRISMDDIRNHPWVTKDGTDTLLSAEENCSDIVDLPTELEMNHAITGNMGNLLAVIKAASRFKTMISRKHGGLMAMFDRDSTVVAPPATISPASSPAPLERGIGSSILGKNDEWSEVPGKVLAGARVQTMNSMASAGLMSPISERTPAIYKQQEEAKTHRPHIVSSPGAHHASFSSQANPTSPGERPLINAEDHAKGHAHDPLEDRLFLNIGTHAEAADENSGMDAEHPIVSESPSASEANIFEDAYREEMDRILDDRGQHATMFMNRRVDHRHDIRVHDNIYDTGKNMVKSGFASLQTKGSAAGDAGREAARNAFDRLNETDWRGARDNASTAASEGYQAAADRVAPRAERAKSKFADLVSKAQTKERDGSSASADAEGVEETESKSTAAKLASLFSRGNKGKE